MALAALALIGTAFAPASSAAETVQLGTASPFAVLAATAVTDVPTSVITGDVGLSPAAGSNYAGLTQAEVTGTIYSTNVAGPAGSVDDPALLTTAQNDLTTAYLSANGQPATTTFSTGDNQLGGKTLTPGVYAFGAAATANITAAGPLVLDGNGVYIFQASSSLITGSGSVVRLEGGAQACNVFWTVGSSATLGSGSTFVGTLMALTSATLDSAATVEGRILARNAAVTLDADTITVPSTCSATTPTTTTPTTTPTTTTPTTTPTTTTPTTTTPTTPTTTTPTTASSTTPTTSPGVFAGSTSGGSAGSGGSGGTAAGSAGTTGTSAAAGSTASGATGGTGIVPIGFPHTGLGGAARTHDGVLIGLGVLALFGGAAVTILGLRRKWYPVLVAAVDDV